MGAGASINKVWQIVCADRMGKKRYRTLTENVAYVYAARGLTIAYFVLALTCLWTPELPQLISLMGRLGLLGLSGAFVAAAINFPFAFFAFHTPTTPVGRGLFSGIRCGVVTSDTVLRAKKIGVVL